MPYLLYAQVLFSIVPEALPYRKIPQLLFSSQVLLRATRRDCCEAAIPYKPLLRQVLPLTSPCALPKREIPESLYQSRGQSS